MYIHKFNGVYYIQKQRTALKRIGVRPHLQLLSCKAVNTGTVAQWSHKVRIKPIVFASSGSNKYNLYDHVPRRSPEVGFGIAPWMFCK